MYLMLQVHPELFNEAVALLEVEEGGSRRRKRSRRR
jgi:hypothetical protein